MLREDVANEFKMLVVLLNNENIPFHLTCEPSPTRLARLKLLVRESQPPRQIKTRWAGIGPENGALPRISPSASETEDPQRRFFFFFFP